MFSKATQWFPYARPVLAAALIFSASCAEAPTTAPILPNDSVATVGIGPVFDVAPQQQVFTSGTNVRTWDAIIPAAAYANWETTVCTAQPLVGRGANWQNEHDAFVLTGHPWANSYFFAPWINAWNSLGSVGPSGHNWTKYRTQVQGNGSFVISLLADNCSWIYLDGTLVGVQGTNLAANSYGLTMNGSHNLEFIIFDGGGAAGGKFRLETTTNPPPPLNPDLDGDGCLNEVDAFPLDPTRCVGDNSAPVITPIIPAPSGQNGWYTGDVNLTWSVVDNESPITSSPCPAVTVVNNTAGITFTCNATSAGGTSSRSVTIKRDNTPPVITETITGTPGDNGWYVSTVNVTFSISDDVSNVPSPNCPTPPVDFDTPGVDRFCTATNFAGLNATKTVRIKRDTQRPMIAPAVTGTPGMNQWFVTDVGLTWIITETGSGVASAIGCDPYSQTTDTPLPVSLSCTVKDRAGNANFRPFILKRDASLPTIAKSVTGTIGNDDWFTTDMTLNWTVTPNGPSGLASPPCPSSSVNTDTPGILFKCFAKTGAGRVIEGQANIKRDASVPVATPTVTGTPGSDGWYTSNVSVSWGVIANGPSRATSSCTTTTISDDTNGQTVECEAVSGAGKKGLNAVNVKRDATVPVVTPTVSGTTGSGGWYTSDVSVSWGVATGPSRATSSCAVSTLSINTASQAYGCSATSGAGLTGTGSVTVKRDNSTPTITPTVTGTMGSNGWYKSDVSVSWSVIANGPSGATSPCAVSTQTTDTNGTTVDCSATSGAGIDASNSVDFKRDATNPLVGFTDNAGTYTVDQTVSITCSASDAMSLLASSTCAPITGSAYSFGVGTTTRTASALDVAGNSSSATTSFTVRATAATLCTVTRLFVTGPGEEGVESSMCGKLEKGNYGPYINEVQAQSGKKITAANANILITWARTL